MSVVESIKLRATLHDVAGLLGIQLPSRVGRKFSSPFRPDKNPSCSIYERDGALRFRDWTNDIDVDLIGFFALARGLSNAEAIRELAKELRIEWDASVAAESRPRDAAKRIVSADGAAPTPRPMPSEVGAAWSDGCRYLSEQPKVQEKIAHWRGWTPEVVRQLADDSMMGTPKFRGERLVAFRVDFPVMADIGPFGRWFSTIQVGWHVRLKANAGEKAQWRFVPNEKEHGRSTPALPFIMGDFQSAQLLVVTEGQFDSITVAHAAGWLSHDAAWPDGICVLGLRGVCGVNPFLSHYTAVWPRDVKCWCLPDNDAAGKAWFESAENGEPSFAEQLSARCSEVRVETITGAKDFNQAWQRDLVKQGDILRQLQINGFTNHRGHIR
jgi:hypothetical protein